MLGNRKHSVTVLAVVTSLDLAAHIVCHFLQAVTDTEDRYAGIKHSRVDAGCVLIIHRVRRTRQDNTLGLKVEIGHLLGAWQELTVDTEFTNAAGD